jgi:hypothetical protein
VTQLIDYDRRSPQFGPSHFLPTGRYVTPRVSTFDRWLNRADLQVCSVHRLTPTPERHPELDPLRSTIDSSIVLPEHTGSATHEVQAPLGVPRKQTCSWVWSPSARKVQRWLSETTIIHWLSRRVSPARFDLGLDHERLGTRKGDLGQVPRRRDIGISICPEASSLGGRRAQTGRLIFGVLRRGDIQGNTYQDTGPQNVETAEEGVLADPLFRSM